MSRTSRTASSEQKNEGQRDEAATSAESTSMISTSPIRDEQTLTADEHLEAVNEQADTLLGTDDPNKDDLRKRINVKTTGPYMVYDPTTGESVTEAGGEMILSPFVQSKLDDGRLIKA